MSDAARQEAERRYMPAGRPALVGEQCLADGFVDGAAWQREQPVEVTSAMADTAAETFIKEMLDHGVSWPRTWADMDPLEQERMRHEMRAALDAALNGGTE